MELGITSVLSIEDTHRGDYLCQGATEGPYIYTDVHGFVLNSPVRKKAKQAFSSQPFLGWEDTFQGHFSVIWKSLPPAKNWHKPVLSLLMLVRAPHICFGLKNEYYCLYRHCLQLQVNLWFDAPLSDVLINRSTFPDRERIVKIAIRKALHDRSTIAMLKEISSIPEYNEAQINYLE